MDGSADGFLGWLPLLNTTMVSTSGLVALVGYILIRRGRRKAHQNFMITGVALMSLFLISYLIRIYLVGFAAFTGTGLVRTVYLTILASHIILAMASVPLILGAVYRGLRQEFPLHRRIARWALPVWLYVAGTGAVIYYMLHYL